MSQASLYKNIKRAPHFSSMHGCCPAIKLTTWQHITTNPKDLAIAPSQAPGIDVAASTFSSHNCKGCLASSGGFTNFRMHQAWAKRRTINLKQITTERCLKSTTAVSLIVKQHIGILLFKVVGWRRWKSVCTSVPSYNVI